MIESRIWLDKGDESTVVGDEEGEKVRVMSLRVSLLVNVCAKGWWWDGVSKQKRKFFVSGKIHIYPTLHHTTPHISSKRKQKKYKWNEERNRENLTEKLVLYNKIRTENVCTKWENQSNVYMFHVKKNLHPPTFNYLYKCEPRNKSGEWARWWWWKQKKEMPRFFFMLIWKEKFEISTTSLPPPHIPTSTTIKIIKKTHTLSKTKHRLMFWGGQSRLRINFSIWMENKIIFGKWKTGFCEVWMWKKKIITKTQ